MDAVEIHCWGTPATISKCPKMLIFGLVRCGDSAGLRCQGAFRVRELLALWQLAKLVPVAAPIPATGGGGLAIGIAPPRDYSKPDVFNGSPPKLGWRGCPIPARSHQCFLARIGRGEELASD